MNHTIKVGLIVFLCCLFSLTFLPLVQAAPQATLVVKGHITNPADFWNCTFVKDGSISKAFAIKLEWSVDETGRNQKTETLISQGKPSGQVSIITDRKQVVNILVTVRNSKNESLGQWNMQIANTGQTQALEIALPDSALPTINTSED